MHISCLVPTHSSTTVVPTVQPRFSLRLDGVVSDERKIKK